MQQTTLGDDLAQATGVRLRPIRLAMMATAVVCTATSTAVAGPIAFVALAAPQIGRPIVGGAGTTLLPAALTGAFLLLSADLLAQALLAPESLPVGVVTTCIGGAYLDPADQATLSDWARHLHVSTKTLQRDFERTYGVSFSPWRTERRLALARTLLESEPVSRVAALVGYHSSSAFIAAFRRQHGCTPAQSASQFVA